MSSRPNMRTVAVTLSALIIPFSMVVGATTAVILKSNNPDNVDITNGLAYLQPTLLIGLSAGVVIGLIVIALIVRMYRRDHDFSNAKLPLMLLIATVVLFGTFALLNSYTGAVEDQYRTDHGQPTLDQYFDAIDKQNGRA